MLKWYHKLLINQIFIDELILNTFYDISLFLILQILINRLIIFLVTISNFDYAVGFKVINYFRWVERKFKKLQNILKLKNPRKAIKNQSNNLYRNLNLIKYKLLLNLLKQVEKVRIKRQKRKELVKMKLQNKPSYSHKISKKESMTLNPSILNIYK